MRIVHATNSLTRSGGGTPHVVWGLALEQQAAGQDVSVLGLADEFDFQDWPQGWNKADVRTYWRNKPQGIAWSLGLHRDLLSAEFGGRADVLHQHGIWSMLSYSVSRWQRRWSRPAVIAAHGMLDGPRLIKSRWKKLLFTAFCEKANLRRAACLHALCRQEAESMRAYGLKNPIAVVPNGISLESYANLPSRDCFSERFPQCKNRPLVLYMGRITQLKGISPLLDAWRRLENRRRGGWMLVVAGPNQEGFADEMKAKSTALGLDRDVLFPGPLYGEAKREALAAANIFVLPSFTEGFAMSLLEAMACRLPLVITRQCNLDEVGTLGAGWVGEPEDKSLSEMLAAAASLGNAARRRIGNQGYSLVSRKYTWQRVSEQMLQVYRWLTVGGLEPSHLKAA